MTRKVLWAVLVIGALLIVLPFAFQMPSRTAAGARMMNSFQPIMQPNQVQKTAYYYDNVFTPLGKVAPAINAQTVAKFDHYLKGFGGMQTDAQKLVPALAQAMHMTPAQVQAYMGKQFPTMSAMLANMPQMQKDFGGFIGMMRANTGIFGQVNAGLAHYKPLVTTMQANVNDFQSVNSLPSFRLFTWFFLIPGLLLFLLAGFGLWYEHREHVHVSGAHPTPA
jgi:hypothetical protein